MQISDLLTEVPAVHDPPIRKITIDHLSWSALTTYSMCPRKYFYHYVERAPQEFVHASLAFGGAFHQAAEQIHQARFENASIPDVEALMKIYDVNWNESTGEKRVAHAKGESAQTLRESAERMITAYRNHVVNQASSANGVRPVAIEHTRRFRLHPEIPPIQMRIDLLEVNGGELIVTDIKTSRSRWNETKAREALPQLVLYSLGILPLLKEFGVARIVPQFAIVTKAKTAAVQVLRPTACSDDVTRLKRQIFETWDGIRKQVFVQRPGWPCSQCPYQKRCLGS
jgi:CRISPR/Cas system-associated exonuclease Cas4 (RecB family)